MTWWGEAGARSLTGGSVAFTRRRKWRGITGLAYAHQLPI
jgi:hypothetical protein